MKKKNLLLTLLSLITVVSLAFPAVTAAFAEDSSAANPRMLTVEIFNGGEDGVELAGATFAKEDGASVVSIETGAWADGKIMLIEPQDLSAAREEGKLYYEYKTTGTTSWGKIGIVTFANYWNEGAYVNDGDSIGVSENYTVKSFDLSAFTAEQLAKFKGFAIGTSANFVFKRIWVEYPNPDYVEPAGGIELITEEELANVGANQGGNVTVTVSGNKELTLVPKDGAGKDVFGKYTARLTKLSKKKLTRALFNDGVVTFDYKTTDATAFELRLMNDGNGVEWGEYNFSVVPVEITADGEKMYEFLTVYRAWYATLDGKTTSGSKDKLGCHIISGMDIFNKKYWDDTPSGVIIKSYDASMLKGWYASYIEAALGAVDANSEYAKRIKIEGLSIRYMAYAVYGDSTYGDFATIASDAAALGVTRFAEGNAYTKSGSYVSGEIAKLG